MKRQILALGVGLVLSLLTAAHAAPGAAAHVPWGRLQAKDFVADELVIVYRDGTTDAVAGRPGVAAWRNPDSVGVIHRTLGAAVADRCGRIKAERVRLPPGRTLAQLQAAAERYARDPAVASVEPNYRVYPNLVPNDPEYPDHLWGLTAINAEQAWDTTVGSDAIVVAVIDTGINMQHQDLTERIWTNPGESGLDSLGRDKSTNGVDDDSNGYVDDVHGFDFHNNDNDATDDHGHGTHVAGTVGATGNNGVGVVGVNWRVGLVPIKGLGVNGGDTFNLTKAIEYVAWFDGRAGRPRIHLSNNSWGGGAESAALYRAIQMAADADQLFIAAAGNSSTDNDLSPHFPSSYTNDNLIAVASLAQGTMGSLVMSSFSCYGLTSVDLGAPGSDIFSCSHSDNAGYLSMSGTSMACPQVAGAAALLWSIVPSAPYATIRDAILNAALEPANQVADLNNRTVTGGKLNLVSAIRYVGDLMVTPKNLRKMAGPPGGAFFPGELDYQLQNTTTNPLSWTLTLSQDWLTARHDYTGAAVAGNPLTGILDPGASYLVMAATNDQTSALATGLYTNVLTFANDSNPADPTNLCTVALKVSHNYQFQSTPFVWTPPGAGASELTRTQLGLQAVPVPFAFRFYNVDYSNVWVSGNGVIAFSPAFPPTLNAQLPQQAVENAFVMPLWDALRYTPGTSRVHVEAITNDAQPRLVVTWQAMGLADASGSALLDFQAVLYANQGDNSSVACHYRRVAQDDMVGAGRGATVGVQDDGAFMASEYTFNGQNRVYGTMELADRQGLLFTWQDRLPDAVNPAARITSLYIIPGDEMAGTDGYASFEVRFDEIVLGLDASDFDFDGTTVPGAYVSGVSGGGERFIVEVEGFRGYGRIVIRLKDGAVVDLAGNPNLASDACIAVVPFGSTQLFDTFENGVGEWTVSTNVYAGFTTAGWQLGPPPATQGLMWPTSAYSGLNCWGTVLSNAYPNLMDGWLQSPLVYVANRPAVDLRIAYDFASGDYALLEANMGSGWINITPRGYGGLSTYGQWTRLVSVLPPEFANRPLRFRVRMISNYAGTAAGVYVDDFRVLSLEDPGVWLLSARPNPLSTASNQLLDTLIYNSGTQNLAQVSGTYGSPDSSMAMLTTAPVPYGGLRAGDVQTNRVVRVLTAAPALFQQPRVPLNHDAFVNQAHVSANYVTMMVQGLPPDSRTKRFTAQAMNGVKDWMGRPLSGAGDRRACLFQVLSAGADGVVAPPTAGGQPTGDDAVLYTFYDTLPFGRFGGQNVAFDLGRFNRQFLHGLPAGTKVYSRAWDGATFDQSAAYGDSALHTLTSADSETRDFDGWTVGTPTQYTRDLNGDTIPDGWSIAIRIDPRAPVAPLATNLAITATLQGNNEDTNPSNNLRTPRRAARLGNFVYVASRRIGTDKGAVMVYNPTLGTRLATVTSVTTNSATYEFDPSALCVDTNRNRVIVADYGGRILVFAMNPATGGLTFRSATPAYGSTGTPDQTGRFKQPLDVAVHASGDIFVIDAQFVANGSTGYYRIQRLDANGLDPRVWGYIETPPSALAIAGPDLFLACRETGVVHAVQIEPFVNLFSFGAGPGAGLGNLSAPEGISVGVGGRMYVMEKGNNRLQVFSRTGVPLAVYPVETLNNANYGGSAVGQFWKPEGVQAMITAQHTALAADTGNNRVQWIKLLLDVDGDGMDDVWEDMNGLDSSDPSDAAADPDGDGLSNIGEFRSGTNPNDPDSNDNGGGDLWDMSHGVDPIQASAPVTPPRILSLVSDRSGLVAAGETVTLTATFSESISSAATVQLALIGGATTVPAGMTRISATVYQFVYTVTTHDAGDVSARLTGAVDLQGYDQDPVTYTSGVLFSTAVTPPTVISLVSDAAAPLVAGETVLLTATFNKEIDAMSNVRLALQGGASTLPLLMTRVSGTVYTIDYTVGATDGGDVSAVVTGAVDLDGHAQSPAAYVSGPLFTVHSPLPAGDFAITRIGSNPLILEWEAIMGRSYLLRSGPTPTGTWADVAGPFVAPADGTLGYTNAMPPETTLFYQVIRQDP